LFFGIVDGNSKVGLRHREWLEDIADWCRIDLALKSWSSVHKTTNVTNQRIVDSARRWAKG